MSQATQTTQQQHYYYTRVARRKHCKRKYKQTGAKHHSCNQHIDPDKTSADLEANVWAYQHRHSGRGFRDTQRSSERGRAKQPMQQEQSVPKEQRGKEGRGAATAGSIPFEKYNRGSYTSGDGTNEWMHNGDKWAQIRREQQASKQAGCDCRCSVVYSPARSEVEPASLLSTSQRKTFVRLVSSPNPGYDLYPILFLPTVA